MKHNIFLFGTIIITLLTVSCEKSKPDAAQIIEDHQKETVREEAPGTGQEITTERPAKPTEQGRYSIINGSIYYEPSEEKNDTILLPDFVPEDPDYMFGLNNAVKDFSSFNVHPLEKLAGKWRYLDYYGNKHESGSYIEIYKDGRDYKYNYHYYGSAEKGTLLYMPNGSIVLGAEKISNFSPPKKIIGSPVMRNNSPAILLDNEGPIGYFRLETEADNDFSALPVEYVNGSWTGRYELIDGTPIEKKQFSWGRGFSLLDTSLEFDLGRKTLFMPGPGVCRIESAFKDEEGSICLKVIPIDDKTLEGAINLKISFLDYNKAYISHDKRELTGDNRYSPEEKLPWFRLSGPEGD